MSSTSLWRWTTFVVLTSRIALQGPFCVTETVQGSSPLSGASKTDWRSALHQVCCVTWRPFLMTTDLIGYPWYQKVRNVIFSPLCLSVCLSFMCFHYLFLSLSTFFVLSSCRIPGCRLWLGRLPEKVRSRGSSSTLLPNCRSTFCF